MNIKRLTKIALPMLALFGLLLVTGCKKPCELAVEDSNIGIIDTSVIVYSNTSVLGSLQGDYVIDASSPYAPDFQMSP